MQYLFALLPILILLSLMIFLKWSGQRAGPVAWLSSCLIAWVFFGLTLQIFWVSRLKGLLLAIFVLLVIWPALFLYNLIKQTGGITAFSDLLAFLIKERGFLLIILAWGFSGLLEGIAGFGIPIAVVAPILVGLGVEPVTAVVAVAVGHSWSITFGDMGIIYQTLIGVVKIDGAALVPLSSLFLGIACIACGLGAAKILKQMKYWPYIILIGLIMATVQFGMAAFGITPLAALVAGLSGIIIAVLLSIRKINGASYKFSPSLKSTFLSYGSLIFILSIIYLVKPIYKSFYPLSWQMQFPGTTTLLGFSSPAASGQVFRFLLHPGVYMVLVSLVSYWILSFKGLSDNQKLKTALHNTLKAAGPASIGIIATMGISGMMDQCGMTLLLAKGLSALTGNTFPIVSPFIGILGAFATGSNNNSNVLFAPLQKSVADLLSINPLLLIATQTTGGALGSMLAPAKIIVGCSTVGIEGKVGDALKKAIPYGLFIGLIIGGIAFFISKTY